MRRFTCQFEELDEKTREYLHAVRNSSARRMPGVYFGKTNSWPVIALLAGPVIALMFVAMGFASLKDAWATAMLQTAGVMLGGWMVLYAFRRVLGKSSPKYAGFFSYFDPHAAYQAIGEQVTVTDVTNVNSVTARGGQGVAAVRFEDGNGVAMVTGITPAQAVLVEDYYAAMEWIANRDEDGKKMTSAVLGGAAKEYALTEQLPRDYAELNLEVEEIPESPEKVRTAGPRLMWYLFLLGCGVGTFALFSAVNKPIRDETAFASAGNTPSGLRGYLLDDRNTAHREEAEKKLAALYDGPIDRVRTNDKADPILREGLAKLLDTLREPAPPVVSIRVTNAANNPLPLAEFELKNLQEQIGDGIAQVVGHEHIRFLVPESGENPHIEVVVTVAPPQEGPKITCDVAIRLKPDGEPVAKECGFWHRRRPHPQPGGPFKFANGTVYRVNSTVLTALVGQVVASPAVPPPDADDS